MGSKKLRIVFFGTPQFALPTLKVCFEHAHLLAVVCQPDRPRGRGHKVLPCETRAFAIENNIPSFAPQGLRKDSPEKTALLQFLEASPADLFVVVAYGNLFPEEFLKKALLGAVNLHASLLPRWRGAAPIQRTLESGDAQTGVCLQKMELKLDAGDVLAEKALALTGEDALELSEKLSQLGAELTQDFLIQVSTSQKLPEGYKQNESAVTFAEKIKKEEGHYRLSWTSSECLNKIRAFRAWPQVKLGLDSLGEIKLLKASSGEPTPSRKSGEIYLKEGQVFLACSDHKSLRLEIIQSPGKAPTPAYSVFQNLMQSYGQKALGVLEILESENK